MDFLDPGGLRRVCMVPPRGAEPLSVCLINRQERGLFQDDVRGPNKKARWAKNTTPLSSSSIAEADGGLGQD